MVDTRELILARLVEVVATVPNLRSAHRNETDLTDDQLPAGNVLDGDEDTGGAPDLGHPPDSPTVMQMTPDIVITQQAEAIGSDLTTLRRELVRRVLFDTELIGIVGAGRGGNGAIRYLGCETSFGWQQRWYGALQVRFMFKYWLKPNDL